MWTFNPILKSVIWGGDKISTFKGVDSADSNIGESWEISSVDGHESVVAEGNDCGLTLTALIEKYGARLMGERNYKKFGNSFPLLIKFIDAANDLSVQVHPDDELASERGFKFGKNEMWYVLEAEPNARIANGFNHEVNPEDYYNLISSGKIMDILNFNQIQPGDTFFIPAGRVHAIGKGTFLTEIQQTSDVTYRLYDYGRLDKDGRPRQLHLREAFEAINFKDTDGRAIDYSVSYDIPVNLVTSPYFTVNIWKINHEVIRDYSEWDTFVVLICTKGAAQLSTADTSLRLTEGHTVLIPAVCSSLTITPDSQFEALETYIK